MDPIIGGAIFGAIIGVIVAFIYALFTTKGVPKSRTEALQGVRGKGPGCGQQIFILIIAAILGAIAAGTLGTG